MSVFTEIEGLADLELYFKTMPDVTAKASSLAINRTINREGLAAIRDEMYSEVNFPNNYLKGDRLRVSQNATPANLEGIVIARKRATSLARFAAPGTPIGSSRAGSTVRVSVKSGSSTAMRNAWLVRLRQGKSLTEDQFNVGLAIRVKPGDSIGNKSSAHQAWLNAEHTVALLYGPSVDQVFRDVRNTVAPQILNFMAAEFFRQFDRLA